MTRKNMKKLFLLAFAATGALCVGSGFALGATTNADAATVTGGSVYDFYVSGVGVRTVNDEYGAGIRFHTLMSDEMYANLGSGYETGTLFLPELLYSGDLSVTTENVACVKTTGGWYDSATDGFMQSTAYVYGVPESYYGAKLIAVSYIKTADGAYVYSAESPSASMADVAQDAISKDASLADALSKYLVDEVSVKFVYDGNTVTESYLYGDSIYAPAVSKEGYNVVWTTKNGTVWDFNKNKATGNVTLTANYVSIAPTQQTVAPSALKNGVLTDKTVEGYDKVYKLALSKNEHPNEFISFSLADYTEVRFKVMPENGTIYVGLNAGDGNYFGIGDSIWREIIVTNNGDGTVTVSRAGVEGSYTCNSTNLQEAVKYIMWNANVTFYATELKGTKKATAPVAESGLADFGYKILNTGLANATRDGNFDGVPVYKQAINVASGGKFGADFDFSAYDEIRFNFKHSAMGGLSFIGGGYAISTATDTWYYVSLRKEAGTWQAYVKTDPTAEYALAYAEGSRPGELNTPNLNGILSFYNWGAMEGTLYVTQVRGMKNPSAVATAISPLANGTLTEQQQSGYNYVYSTGIDSNDKAWVFADLDLSSFKEVRFKANVAGNTTFIGWDASKNVALPNWEWREVVVTNNGNGSVTVTQVGYGDTFTYETTNLKEVFRYTLYNNGGTLYTTELKITPSASELYGEEISATAVDTNVKGTITKLSLADGVVIPKGYKSVTRHEVTGALLNGAFADAYILPYSEVRFMAKSAEWVLADGSWNAPLTDAWHEYVLTKVDGANWTLEVLKGETVAYTGSVSGATLQEALYKAKGSWMGDIVKDSTVLLATEIRGIKDGNYTPSAWAEEVGVVANNATRQYNVAPEGFKKVYSASAWSLATTDISGYAELRFAMRTNGFFLWKADWSDCTQKKGVWTYFTFVQNNDGTWNVTVDYNGKGGDRTLNNVAGSTLAQLLPYNVSPVDKDYSMVLMFTELRGVEKEVSSDTNNVVLEKILTNSTLSDRTVEGYTSVYQLNLTKSEHMYEFVSFDISKYAEVRFKAISGSSTTYIGYDGGSKYLAIGSSEWREVVITNNGDGSVTVSRAGIDGSYTYESTDLREVLRYIMWNTDAVFYVTELHAIENNAASPEGTPFGSVQEAKGIAVVDAKGKPGYDEYTYAADELKKWSKQLLGKDLPILYTESLEEVPSGYFVIGYDLACQVGLDLSGLSTETGYKIENYDGRVYLYGKTKYGALNAVYGLFEKAMGLIFYTDTVYTYTQTDDIILPVGEYTVFNPSIDYNYAADGVQTVVGEDYVNKANQIGATGVITESSYYYDSKYYPNWDYQRRLGYVNSWNILGGGWHNFTSIMPYDKYGSSHPEWYANVTDWSGATVKTLNLSKLDMVPYVAKEIAALIKSNEANGYYKTEYIFSPPDSTEWPTSNSASDEYLTFINAVAQEMNEKYTFGREINLLLLAYNKTLMAPTTAGLSLYDGKEVDVAVMYAPIQANMYRAITDSANASDYYGGHANSYYFSELQKWQALSPNGKVYYWNYSTYYDTYFVPLDTISNMQTTYQALANSGVDTLLDLGQVGDLVSTDFSALKTFLKGQLAKNVNVVLWTDASTLKGGLVEAFMNAYYGAGGAKMLALLKVEMDWYKTLADEVVYYNNGTASKTGKEAVGHHSGGGQLMWDAKYWDDDDKEGGIFGIGKVNPDSSMLNKWYSYIQDALQAVEGDETLERRINVESMPIRYLLFRMFSDYDVDNDGKQDNTQAQLVAFAKSLGITVYAENRLIDNVS